jgi:Na+-transporting NADH:ubiquinone oxidoreductase subunit B
MKLLLKLQNMQRRHFEKGGRFERFFPLFEAADTFLFTPGKTTQSAPHVRDAVDLKRVMIIVVVALLPCMLMAMYNTGYQAHLAISRGAAPLDNWRTHLLEAVGAGFSPDNVWACFLHGALYFLPVYLVTIAAGGLWEVLFSIVRRHEINEGFLVTSALFPLVLPATIPLWQVALGISFGVVIGKEVFGGTGMNVFNPALMSRAFLYFAYPAEISGDRVWIPAQTSVDAYSGATALAVAKEHGFQALLDHGYTWWQAFVGFVPGSMGETSALFCIVGAIILIVTQVGAWRTMTGMIIGSSLMSIAFQYGIGGNVNPMYAMPFYWHWVLGGFAFATVFMATDPVTSAFTLKGKWIYGFMIGAFGLLIRLVNPAYPGSWMLAILFMNMFAPLIDYFVVHANVKRRMARYAA